MCSIAEFDFEKAQKTNFITQRINAGKGVFGKYDRYMPEPLHLYLPPYIQKSRNLFNHLIIKSQTLAWYLKTPVRYYCYFKKETIRHIYWHNHCDDTAKTTSCISNFLNYRDSLIFQCLIRISTYSKLFNFSCQMVILSCISRTTCMKNHRVGDNTNTLAQPPT